METQLLRSIAYKVFKILKDLNSNFMKEIFYRSPNLTNRKENHYVHSWHTIKFGSKNIRPLAAHKWNSQLENIKNIYLNL